MSKSSTRRVPMVLIVVLAILLASLMSFSIVDGISKADENIVKQNSLSSGILATSTTSRFTTAIKM